MNTAGRSLRTKLCDRHRLRWVAGVTTFAIGLFGIHWPATEYKHALEQRLIKERNRNQLAAEVVALRAELMKCTSHLGPANANEWRQNILEEIRKSALAATSIEPGKTEQFGPFQLVVLKLDLEGGYGDLDAFLERIENDYPLIRIDHLSVAMGKEETQRMTIHLTISGVIG